LGGAACKQAEATARSEAGGCIACIWLCATARSLYLQRASRNFTERDPSLAEHWILGAFEKAVHWPTDFLFTAQRRLDAQT